MHEIIIKELEAIEHIFGKIGTAVSIFGSARIAPDSNLYNLAKQIAACLSDAGYAIISGGGPGLMRAANEGARTGRAKAIGFNIALPFEPLDMRFQDISLTFENFATRKMAFSMCSSAFIVMPGGMGTLDELFEILTLMQTKKIAAAPIVLVGSEFWGGLLTWLREKLERAGLICAGELDAIKIFDDPKQISGFIKSRVRIADIS
jgi:uncharacterized protein (TIGR00730 family)